MTGADIIISGYELSYSTEERVVPTGETKTIEVKNFSYEEESKSYTVTIELKEGFVGKGETGATYSKEVTVPWE